ncbi:MAG: ABC transporter permease [Marinilabiliaceae bacterium]|jgi:putative ABC transport system permease protein|nr:ABC transporter permease [Marinilabiliaceae bacterium]
MIKNLLKTAFRNIVNKFGYTILNILGMTLGITASLFLIMYVLDEISFDRYHEKGDRIYRVQSYIQEPDDEFTWIIAQAPFAPQVKLDYPEVESVTRLFNVGRVLYKYGDIEYNEQNMYYADSTFFDIFSYKLIDGSFEGALDRPNTVVLTESLAQKYFGEESPVGKSLQNGDDLFQVTAVMEDVPRNSHVIFDGLVSRNTLPAQFGSWGNFGVFTYLLLNEGTSAAGFEEKLQEMYPKYMAPIFEPIGIKISYQLMALKDIHLKSDSAQEPQPTGSIQYVIIFGIVAVLLLLIATLNYINLATARSAKRSKEISLRKVVGSNRGPLIAQFLAESSFLTVISLVLGVILIIIFLPKLNMLSGKSFSLSLLTGPVFFLSLLGIMLVVGIIGGLYPALYLSRFNPVEVMKGSTQSGSSKGLFRKILTVVQFTISGAMIACTLIVFSQLSYLQNKDQGWNMDRVVMMQLPDNEPITKMKLLKERLLNSPLIENVTLTSNQLGEGSPKVIFNVETDEGMQQRGVNFAVVDDDFTETLGIEVLEGRDFSIDYIGDTITGVLVNQTLADRFNWDEPLGKKVQLGDGTQIMGSVIGLIRDYHQTGMYNEVESLMLLFRLDNAIMYVKLGINEERAIEAIGQGWEEVFPGREFDYTYLSENFSEQFGNDRNRSTIFLLFTLLTIVIACLGLFGLASYTVEKRTGEIGVRKVFGASETKVLGMISFEFMLLMLIAFVIATPVVIYLMSDWLQDYVYRINISPLVFLYTIILTLVPTALTISYQALKAARTNPAEALREQ